MGWTQKVIEMAQSDDLEPWISLRVNRNRDKQDCVSIHLKILKTFTRSFFTTKKLLLCVMFVLIRPLGYTFSQVTMAEWCGRIVLTLGKRWPSQKDFDGLGLARNLLWVGFLRELINSHLYPAFVNRRGIVFHQDNPRPHIHSKLAKTAGNLIYSPTLASIDVSIYSIEGLNRHLQVRQRFLSR